MRNAIDKQTIETQYNVNLLNIYAMIPQKPTKLFYPSGDVFVAPDIIREACRANNHRCMIADAIRRHILGAKNVVVDLTTIRYSLPEKGLRYIFHTPRKVQLALMKFDAGRPISPFKFRLHSGHIVSMRDKKGHVQHRFGRPKTTGEKGKNGGVETVTVGGTAPPKWKPPHLPPHPSHGSIRRFGLGGFTSGDGTHVFGWTVPAE